MIPVPHRTLLLILPLLLVTVVLALLTHAQSSGCGDNEVLQRTSSGFSCVSVNTITLTYGNAVGSATCDTHQVLKITDTGLSCVCLLTELLEVCGAEDHRADDELAAALSG